MLVKSFKIFCMVLKYVLPIDLACVVLSYFVLVFSVERLYDYYGKISAFEPLIASMNILNVDELSEAVSIINQSLSRMYVVIFGMFILLFLLMVLSQSINWRISCKGVNKVFSNYVGYFWNFVLISLVFLILPLLFLGVFAGYLVVFLVLYLILVYFCLVGYGLVCNLKGVKLFRKIFVLGVKKWRLFLVYLGLIILSVLCFGLFFYLSNVISFYLAGLISVVLVLLVYGWFRVFVCEVLRE